MKGYEIKWAFRSLSRQPMLVLSVIVTLALGISASTVIFSVVHGVLLQPWPFKDAQRLAIVFQNNPQWQILWEAASGPNYADWKERNEVFEDLVAADGVSFTLQHQTAPIWLEGAQVSPEFFQVLGMTLRTGHPFRAEDHEPSAGQTVILGPGVWRTYFGSDPEIVGQTIDLEMMIAQGGLEEAEPARRRQDRRWTVMGVLDSDLQLPDGAQPDLFVPQTYDPALLSRERNHLQVLGRLLPGVDLDRAQAEMSRIALQLAEDYPEENEGWGAWVVPYGEWMLGDVNRVLWVLLAAAGLVLAIGCLNVANLLLARGRRQQRELAVRAAVGAARGDLIRQLLIESLLLALLSGISGVLLAIAGLQWLKAVAGASLPRIEAVELSFPVLLFAMFLTLLTGLFFGLLPALRTARPDLIESLKSGIEGWRQGSGGRSRFRGVLITIEVASALILLIGAGLLGRSMQLLERVDAGFEPDRVVALKMSLPETRYPSPEAQEDYFRRALERLRGLPMVHSVGTVDALPLIDFGNYVNFRVRDSSAHSSEDVLDASLRMTSPGYFSAMGIPLLAGRAFEEADLGQRRLLIDESFARWVWPGGDAVGRQIQIGFGADGPAFEVIGVVGGVRSNGISWEPVPTLYLPRVNRAALSLAVRSGGSGDGSAWISDLREAVLAIDPDVPPVRIQPMSEIRSQSLASPRLRSVLLMLFSGTSLILAVVGLYSVLSRAVTARQREIGLRMALGADRSEVLAMVVRQGMGATFVGIFLGLLVAFGLSRLLESLVFGITTTDPIIFALSAVLVLAMALLASLLPARRAAGVDPVEVLQDV